MQIMQKTANCKRSPVFNKHPQRAVFRLPVQMLRIMRMTSILLLIFCMHVSAKTSSQSITFSGKTVSLKKIFSAIEKQTGYVVFASKDLLTNTKPVTVSVADMPLTEFLKITFRHQPLKYRIEDKIIVLTPIQVVSSDRPEFPVVEQDLSIAGRITDSTGAPLSGATVAVRGKSQTVTTNADGRFVIEADPGDMLIITYVGYETIHFKVAADTKSIALVLKLTVAAMEEIAVISTGYQTLKKGQLTGAYSTLDRNTYLQTVPVSGNIVENMEGRIAGMMLNLNQSRNNWSNPNNTSPFTIRGVSTLQAIKKPLIVLNGYPTEIDIESINPYDIESITVLKDAASAAIYGVRASNGVIVINTKKGASGKPVFNFTTSLTHKSKPNYDKLDLLKGRGFVDFESASGVNDIENNFMSKDVLDMLNATYTPVFSITDDLYNNKITKEEADKLFNELGSYDNTDDYKRLFLQNQLFQTYDFNISGGGTASTYFLGVNHVNNKGLEKHSGFQKTNINYKGSFDFLKRFSLDVQSIYSNINTQRVTIPDYMQLNPYQRFLDADGKPLAAYFAPFNEKFFGFGASFGTISTARNEENIALGLYDEMYYPYQEMFESGSKTRSDIFRLQGNLKTKIAGGLNLEIGGVFEKQLDNQSDIASERAYETRIMLNYFAQKDPISGNPVFKMPQGGIRKTLDNNITSYTLRAQLNYTKTLDQKHDLSLLGGVERRRMTNSGSLNTAFGYNNNTLTIKPMDLSLLGNYTYYPDFSDVIVSGMSYAFDQTTFSQYFNETYADDRFMSYYANAAYTYDRKYTVTGSMRIDQSNLFGTDPKFRYTPLWSAGVSWNVINEDFLARSTWISDLKLRVAAGYNGNIIKRSGPFNILSSEVNTYVPNPIVGYSISSPRNNSLRWEKTFNFNTGVDFSFFDGRIGGSVDYYIKQSKDVFSPIESDPTLGFTNLLTNNASIENKGIDLLLTSVNVKGKNFSWQTQVTGAFNKSKILKVKNKFNGFYNFTRVDRPETLEGRPLGAVFALDYAGLNELGQPMVRDDKGNLVVLSFNSQVDVPFEALKFVGVNDPKYAIGFNNQFTFGKFNLSALIMYYGGHVALVRPPSIFSDRPTNGVQNYWKKPGDEKNTDIPGFGAPYGDPAYFDVRMGYEYAQKFVRKMDYLTLRDVTVTYNLTNEFSKKIGLRNTKVILQVQNPFKYVFSGNDIDPETLDFVGGQRGLPVVPAFTFSLTTNF